MSAVLVLVFAALPRVYAHDPGLSRVDITAGERMLRTHAVYARRDIEVLVPLDRDGDGIIDDDEWRSARNALLAFGKTSVEIASATQILAPGTSDVTRDDSDGIHFWLDFPRVAGGMLTVASDVPGRLALGHRQFVTMTDANNKVHSSILSARVPGTSFELGRPDRGRQFIGYLREGIHHIWIGYDHILFLLALLLTSPMYLFRGAWIPHKTLKPALSDVIKIVTAFTIAHSLTLALSVFRIVELPPRLVEPAIAASVIIAAAANFFPRLHTVRWHLGFAFGLVHGLGFAGVLADLGLPSGARGVALMAFNLGVEVGQLAIVAVVLPLLFTARHFHGFRAAVIGTGSLAIALVAAVWLVERAAQIDLLSVI